MAVEAAWRVISRDGPYALTLDAVAAEAGLSKGGLLHHFPSKRSLIEGLVEAFIGSTAAGLTELQRDLPPGPALTSRAILAQTATGPAKGPRPELALMAVIANDLSLVHPIKAYLRERFAPLETSPLGFEEEAIVNLALDGLWILELLGLAPLEPRQREAVIAALEARLTPEPAKD